MPAEEDCFVEWWNERYSEPATRREVILRIQQMDGEMVTLEWVQPREVMSRDTHSYAVGRSAPLGVDRLRSSN